MSILGLLGCTPLKQYRELLDYSAAPDCTPGTPTNECFTGFLASKPGYRLGIVEFDDQGELFSEQQFEFVRMHVVEPDSEDKIHAGKIVILFAHGWFNDASPGNPNLKVFRDMLAVLAKDEEAVAESENRMPRMVHGIFLAWRGASSKLPVWKLVTFWNRKDAAHRIGERRATEVILKLRDAAYAQRDPNIEHPNRFILMGHSFGAAVVYSATSQLIAEDLLRKRGSTPSENRLADAVLLFNPAFEGARLRHLFDTAHALTQQLPTLTIFTSESDEATGKAFPAARFFNTLLVKYRSNVSNPVKPNELVSQREEDVRAIGHFDPFITHDLFISKTHDDCVENESRRTYNAESISEGSVVQPVLDDREIASRVLSAQDELTAEYSLGKVLNFGALCLVARKELFQSQMAVLNVSMEKAIWDGHGIDQTKDRTIQFVSFLEHYIPFTAQPKTPRVEAMPSSDAAFVKTDRKRF